jgi:hypothetical protein
MTMFFPFLSVKFYVVFRCYDADKKATKRHDRF